VKHRRLWFLTALLVTSSLIATACGSDDDSTESGDSTKQEDTATTGADAPSGDPIKIMTIMRVTAANQSTTEEAAEAVKLAAEAQNERGGLLGRPVEVIVCDEGGDANKATECARKAISEGVVAVVGSATAQGDAINPVLEEAGIPSIGAFPTAATDMMASTSFPVGGSPAWIAGCTRILAAEGAKKIAIVHFDLPAGAFAAEFAKQGLSGTDAEVESTVPVPIEAVDYNPLVAQAADGADGIMMVLQPEQAGRWLVASAQQGVDVPQCAPGLSNEVIASVGDKAEGIFVSNSYAPVASGGPGVDRFVEEVGDELANDFFTPNSWLAFQLFVGAVEAAAPADVTAETVLAAMKAADGIDLEDVVPPYSTQTPGPGPLTALYNPTYFPSVVKDGKIVAIGDAVNAFTG
jgi:ABC-type branched-subunit amino acid transport system substrate-binding protein